jgi:alpha-beta hydrolase superfamily lysophospholipase
MATTAAGLALLAGCATSDDAVQYRKTSAGIVRETPCPTKDPAMATVRCFAGRDFAGSFVVVAVPQSWNGVLVLHAHGGPFLGAPTLERVEEDFARWAIVPKAGYAWAATSYRQGGVAVHSADEDLDRLRTIALDIVGTPRAVILHGQSWGGNVAAKAAEMQTVGRPYQGVLLTSGVLAGGPRAYEHRLDLRVVYQYLCRNLPKPEESTYPSWMGLAADNRLTRADVDARADECLGTAHDAAARTPQQASRLRTLATVVRIPESSVANELNFATFTFADIAKRYGHPVFGNVGARYQGSDDDVALNAGVQRIAADPEAVRAYAADTDLDGHIDVPVLTMHAMRDPVAFVEMERRFGDRMIAAGHRDNLVQTFSDDAVHSYVSDATYIALLDAISAWVIAGTKPTAAGIAAACEKATARFPSTCRFRPDYVPAPLESRVTERQR